MLRRINSCNVCINILSSETVHTECNNCKEWFVYIVKKKDSTRELDTDSWITLGRCYKKGMYGGWNGLYLSMGVQTVIWQKKNATVVEVWFAGRTSKNQLVQFNVKIVV
jgi:hypothetical protein